MKKVMFLVLIILFISTITTSQEINRAIEPDKLPAWDIQVVCTAPEGCNPPYKIVAFNGNYRKEWQTDNTGYVVAHTDGLPSHDANGNLMKYYITATPLYSEIPCGMVERFYPTGSVYVEIEVRQGPCNMY